MLQLAAFLAAHLAALDPTPHPGCRDARIDRPSLGEIPTPVMVVFPAQPCCGARNGEALILARLNGRWRRLAVLPYDRGANQNSGAFGRRYYRFANDRDRPADMWVENGVLVIERGRQTLLRRSLLR